MKRITTILIILTIALSASAQNGRFGYLNYKETVKLMPEYAEAESKIKQLEEEYASEIEREETELYRQYTEYLHGQKILSNSIILKRQKELQVLYDNSMKFKKEAKESLNAERRQLLEPLELKVLNTVSQIAKDLGLDYVIDLASHSYLYIDTEKGVDISHDVYKALGIETTQNTGK